MRVMRRAVVYGTVVALEARYGERVVHLRKCCSMGWVSSSPQAADMAAWCVSRCLKAQIWLHGVFRGASKIEYGCMVCFEVPQK